MVCKSRSNTILGIEAKIFDKSCCRGYLRLQKKLQQSWFLPQRATIMASPHYMSEFIDDIMSCLFGPYHSISYNCQLYPINMLSNMHHVEEKLRKKLVQLHESAKTIPPLESTKISFVSRQFQSLQQQLASLQRTTRQNKSLTVFIKDFIP